MCGFFRVAGHQQALAQVMPADRGELIRRLCTFNASFAKWRWHTLAKCTGAVAGLQGLEAYWDKSMLDKTKDATRLNQVHEALSRTRFWREVKAVQKLAELVDKTREWAAGDYM